MKLPGVLSNIIFVLPKYQPFLINLPILSRLSSLIEISILVPFGNRPGEKKLVGKLKDKERHISKNFGDAVEFIVHRENGLRA